MCNIFQNTKLHRIYWCLEFFYSNSRLITFIKRATGLEPVSKELQFVYDAKVVTSLCFAERTKQFWFGTCFAWAVWDWLILKLQNSHQLTDICLSFEEKLSFTNRETKLHKSCYQGKFFIIKKNLFYVQDAVTRTEKYKVLLQPLFCCPWGQ